MAFEALLAYQDGLLQTHAVGSDLAVFSGGRAVYRHMNGFANREAGIKVSRDTLFRVFSMTKPLTCVLGMILHDQGRFLMTDPLGKYLPAFARMRVKDEGGEREAENPIRILHLFTMTSGLDYNLDRGSLQKARQAYGADLTMAQAAEAVAEDPLAFEPGTRFCYGLSHDVLGVLIESLCGAGLGECLKEMLFQPLGMKNSFFQVPKGEEGRLAVSYSSAPPFGKEAGLEQYFAGFLKLESGGGGLVMTTDDYLRFARMLLREGADEKGRQLISRAAVRLMRSNHLTEALQQGYMAERPGYGYGLGVRVLTHPEMIGALTGMGEYGWAGAQGSWMMVDPAGGLAAVFMMQGTPGPNREVHPRLRNLIAASAGQKG